MSDDDYPTNYVRLSDSYSQLVVDTCVICGDTHYHGRGDPAVARGDRSHRVAHCMGRKTTDDDPRGYYLKMSDDAERPDVWLNWLRREYGDSVLEVNDE
jgi:hypothetical protein